MARTEFFTDEHFPELCDWFASRGLPSPDPQFLPTNGLIVPGVAAGFLYLTDTPVVILDFFVTNPHSDKNKRGEALDAIVLRLEAYARSHGAKIIICNTKNDGLRDRAVALGFSVTGVNYSLGKEIK